MIMSGKKDGILQTVRLIDIHGTRFYDLEYTHDDAPGQLRSTRIGVESAYDAPQPADHVAISYLMNVVTAIVRR